MSSRDKALQPTLEETVALEQHRAFLEKAQEVAHVGSWVVELDGSPRLSWSAETYRIFGLSVGEFGGTPEAFFAAPKSERTRQFLSKILSH